MTPSDLIALAHEVLANEAGAHTLPALRLARAISDLLTGPGDECGWERPEIVEWSSPPEPTTAIRVPASWATDVQPADAEAMARMLWRATEMAREGK